MPGFLVLLLAFCLIASFHLSQGASLLLAQIFHHSEPSVQTPQLRYAQSPYLKHRTCPSPLLSGKTGPLPPTRQIVKEMDHHDGKALRHYWELSEDEQIPYDVWTYDNGHRVHMKVKTASADSPRNLVALGVSAALAESMKGTFLDFFKNRRHTIKRKPYRVHGRKLPNQCRNHAIKYHPISNDSPPTVVEMPSAAQQPQSAVTSSRSPRHKSTSASHPGQVLTPSSATVPTASSASPGLPVAVSSGSARRQQLTVPAPARSDWKWVTLVIHWSPTQQGYGWKSTETNASDRVYAFTASQLADPHNVTVFEAELRKMGEVAVYFSKRPVPLRL